MVQSKSYEKEDPRVLRTRHVLLQAFADLFVEKGFPALTVQDITERASVNRGTFYDHFEDKYALLEYWLRQQFQEQVTNMMPRAESWNLHTLHLLIQRVIEWFSQFHHQTHFMDRSLLPLTVTTLQEELFELLLQGFKTVAGSRLDQSIDLESLAMVISWAIFGSGFQCFRQTEEQMADVPAELLAQQVTSVLAHGLERALPALPLQ